MQQVRASAGCETLPIETVSRSGVRILNLFVSCNLQVFASVTKDVKEGDKNSSPALKS